MKKLLCFLISLSFCVSYSQDDIFGNSPVPGIIPIKRGNVQENKAKLNNSITQSSSVSPSSPTGSSTEVGVTEGQLSVSLTGGATYNIPIAVPPGINGIVPQISLSYNSQGNNGIAGYGWNISGVSVITRIPSSKYHDNLIDAVDFNVMDRFAFDGQRLIVKNGTSGIYGANETIYETENFSNIQITSYGVHPSGPSYGPAYFIVRYPDGAIAYYGNSTNSRSLTDWAILYWENPQGVRISYEYLNTNNCLSVSSIKYGSRFTITPINEISFVYKTRNRSEQAYIGGQNFIKNNILSEIIVKGENVGFRNYLLSHEITSLGYERLISITEKNGDNSKSFNPTLFRYDTTSEDISFNTNSPILTVNNIRSDNSSTVQGDFDGDGNMDIILYPTTGTNSKKKYWLFSNIEESGTYMGSEHNVGSFSEIFPISWLSWNNKLMPMQGWCIVQNNVSTNTTTFNTYSTGIANPIYFQYSRTYQFPKFTFGYWTSPCDDGGIGIQPNRDTFIDSNNVIVPIDPDEPTYNEIIKDIPKEYVTGDFNGDGLSDVVIIEKPVSVTYFTGGCNGHNATYTNPGGKSYLLNLDRRITTDYINVAGYLQVTSSSKFVVADFNGDGKSDIYIFDDNICRIYSLTASNNFVLLKVINSTNIKLTKPVLMGDYNGDGKSDFIIPKENLSPLFTKYISTGNDVVITEVDLGIGAYSTGFYDGNKSNIQHIIPNDFNNDGKTDIILTKCNYVQSGNVDFVNNNRFISVRYFANKGATFESTMYATKIDIAGLNHFPIPVSLSFDKANSNQQISFISNNNIYSAISPKDNVVDTSLKEIVLGSGVKEIITYQSLNNEDFSYENVFEPSTYTENYPNFDIKVANNFKVVSKLEQVTATQYKQQKLKYYGAVSNTEGFGFLGFRGIARTNWFNDNNPIVSSVSKHDISKRGLVIETYSVSGDVYGNFVNYTPSDFMNKTNMTYVDELLPNKVYKVKNSETISRNGLEGTSKEVITIFDVNNNPTKITTVSKNGSVVDKTEVVDIEYFPAITTPFYIVGRLKKKNSSVNHNGDTMTGEEIYTYNTENLVSKIQKKGHLTNYLTEENSYDIFGNITQKKITALGLIPRISNFSYDSSGRFLQTSTDIEGLITSFTYNSKNGLLLSQTLPSNAGFPLTTNYMYDSWGKKIKEIDYLGKSLNFSYSWLSPGISGFYTMSSTGDDNSASFTYIDDLGRKIADGYRTINDGAISDPKNSFQTFEYDIHDRIVKEYEPQLTIMPQWSGLSTTTTFDQYGRVVQVLDHKGKTSTVNYNGLTTIFSDGTSNKTVVKNSLGYILSMTDNGGTINYQYFANGNLKQSDFNGVVVHVEQDGWGRKSKLTDPSAGVYEYEYNEFGELIKEKNPNGITNYSIDDFGKVTEKVIQGINGNPTNTKTTYTYDSTSKLLTSVRYDDFAGGFFTLYSYGYDNYKRMNFNDESGFNAYYQRATQFDAFGRAEKELYLAINTSDNKQSSKWIRNTYKNGHHWQILDDETNQVLWQTTKVNGYGQLLNGNYGNGITVNNTYDQFGFPTQFKHDKVVTPSVNIMTLQTSFEQQRSNLTYRYNSLFDYREDFTYDNLDRLTTWSNTNELHNFTFTGVTDGFLPTNTGVIVSNISNSIYSRLNVETNINFQGTEKVVKSGAIVGQVYQFSGNLYFRNLVLGNIIKYIVTEKNPTTGETVETEHGIASQHDTFSFQHTVTNYSEISLKIIAGNEFDFQSPIVFSLDNIKVSEVEISNQNYDNLGRIQENNVGTYNYTNVNSLNSVPKHFQNSSIETNSKFTDYYLSRANLDITYNAFKSPIDIIEEGKDKLSFIYNMNNSRSTMYYGSLEADKLLRKFRRHYSSDGSMEIKQDIINGTVEFLTFIGGDAYSAPIVLKSDGTTQNYLYLHRDYLSSIVAITDNTGNIVEKRLFDAWGNIKKVQDGSGNNLNALTVMDRGYTGHEHLQGVNLIHMNGRLYDPVVHRFLQPDNFIQDPYNTQNYNRYSYVLNNPLKYTDSSGELFWTPILIGAMIGAISGGISYIAYAIKTGDWSWGGFGMAIGGGAIIGGITGGISPMSLFSVGSFGQLAATSFAAGFMPAISVPIGDWTLSASPTIAFGNSAGAGISFGVTYDDGNFSVSGGYGIMEYSNYNGFGANSREFRYSALVSYGDGKTRFTLGTNYWTGDFKQRTGLIGIQSGDFKAMYENDGGFGIKTLGLGDRGDSYRTAALNLSVGDYTAGFNLMTGNRSLKNQKEESKIITGYRRNGKPIYENPTFSPELRDDYNRKFRHGFVNETGPKYRLGSLTIGYKNYRVGVNSEHVRHAIQNRFIHNGIKDRGFENQSWNWNSYVQYRSSNIFTSW